MREFTFKIQYVLLCFLFLIACQERKQLSEMHDSTGEMNGTTKSMNNTMADMNNTMKAMAGTMNRMDQTMGKMSGVMENMNGSLNNTNHQIVGMNGTLQRVDGKIGGMHDTLQRVDGKIGGMNDTLLRVDGRIGSMNDTLVNVDGKMSNLDKTIVKLDKRISNLNGTINEVHTEIVDMNKVLKEVKLSMKSLVSKIDAMDGKMGNLVEQLTDMNQVITALGLDMKSMSGKLDGMSAKMGELLDKMVEVFEVARPGMSMILRQTSWNQLKDAENLQSKIAEAAKYFMSFEYQVFFPAVEQELHKRLELASSATNEFFLQIKGLLPNGLPNAKPVNLVSLTNENVEALSATLHRENEVQIEYVKKFNAGKDNKDSISTLSMYSLIVESLLSQNDKSMSPEGTKFYQKVTLQNKDLALWLLKVRLNTLVKMLIVKIPTIERTSEIPEFLKIISQKVPQEALQALQRDSTMLSQFVPRDIDFNELTSEVLEQLIGLMQGILHTKKVLDQIHADSSLLEALQISLGNAHIIDSNLDMQNPLQKKFIDQFKAVMANLLTKTANPGAQRDSASQQASGDQQGTASQPITTDQQGSTTQQGSAIQQKPADQ